MNRLRGTLVPRTEDSLHLNVPHMIERIWVKNFRLLAHNRVDLMPFAVLVGRNATGKSTLMAAIRFVSNSLSLGVQAAVDISIDHAGAGLADLCFDPAVPLQFALEVRLVHGLYRYELEIDRDAGGAGFVSRENLFRLPDSPQSRQLQPSLFGNDDFDELVHNEAPRSQKWRRIAGKTAEGKDYFKDEKTDWNNTFRFGPNRPALGSLPEDIDRFPGAIAVRNLLREGIVLVELDTHALRMPSPPRSEPYLVRDGSNLAAAALDREDAGSYGQWVSPRFVEAVIERGGKRRCLAPVRIEYVVDPMKDSSVVRHADALVRSVAGSPFLF
ncbi:MAG: hypothetical protein EXS06_09515 [Planctomycetaceae bacterium]|nr:hypothetical protein [Planctomycetaceae bacterium]